MCVICFVYCSALQDFKSRFHCIYKCESLKDPQIKNLDCYLNIIGIVQVKLLGIMPSTVTIQFMKS